MSLEVGLVRLIDYILFELDQHRHPYCVLDRIVRRLSLRTFLLQRSAAARALPSRAAKAVIPNCNRFT
jgi:hypothetical protein